MSTSSVIGVLNRSEIPLFGAHTIQTLNCRCVYAHCDGYINGVGDVLYHHFNNSEKAAALVALGDLSRVKPLIAPLPGEHHTFENPAEAVTVAYHRDRGEPYHDIRVRASGPDAEREIVQKLSASAFAHYIYLFDEQMGEWLVCATAYFLSEEHLPGAEEPQKLYPLRYWFEKR